MVLAHSLKWSVGNGALEQSNVPERIGTAELRREAEAHCIASQQQIWVLPQNHQRLNLNRRGKYIEIPNTKMNKQGLLNI